MQKLKENIRQKILQSAAAEFNEKGFDHASMRRIAAQAGITPGNIYRYFKNKKTLLTAVLQPIMTEINRALLESTDGKMDMNADIEDFLKKNETFNIDVKNFSKKFVAINHQYKDGMSFIAKEEAYRSPIHEWLSEALFAYYGSRRKEAAPELIKMLSSIASITLIDTVTESLRYDSACEKLHLDESEVIYECITSIMNKGETLV
jgi:AcrR family transcriptional regulator